MKRKREKNKTQMNNDEQVDQLSPTLANVKNAALILAWNSRIKQSSSSSVAFASLQNLVLTSQSFSKSPSFTV